MGALLGSLVGQTESNIRQALRIVDAMAPCVLMIDEVEKALAGVASSGQTDSGVSARLFGTFLQWLNDHESDVFVVCTCNDISKLPPEFSRAERFDSIFFLDLPGATQKAAIWDIWLRAFELDSDQPKPKTPQWTGAEIRACCRLAALLDVPLTEAAQNVVPVAVTAAESCFQIPDLWFPGGEIQLSLPGKIVVAIQDRIDSFNVQMEEFRDELQEAVSRLDEHYGELQEAARQQLGSLFNEADYPPSLQGLFSVQWDFPSVEPPDYLQQLNPDLYQQECQRVTARFNEAVQLAEQAFMEELQKLVEHLTERLSGRVDGKPEVFRDSAVNNLTEFFQRFRATQLAQRRATRPTGEPVPERRAGRGGESNCRHREK